MGLWGVYSWLQFYFGEKIMRKATKFKFVVAICCMLLATLACSKSATTSPLEISSTGPYWEGTTLVVQTTVDCYIPDGCSLALADFYVRYGVSSQHGSAYSLSTNSSFKEKMVVGPVNVSYRDRAVGKVYFKFEQKPSQAVMVYYKTYYYALMQP